MRSGVDGVPGWVRSTRCDARLDHGPHRPIRSPVCAFCGEPTYRMFRQTQPFTQRRFVIYEEPF